MKKICVVTGSRAEYGHLFWLMKDIQLDPALRLQIVATGTHLSPSFGRTANFIERDGFKINQKIKLPFGDDTSLGTAKNMAAAVAGFGRAFEVLKPDIVVVLGDRFEMLCAAEAALVARVPLAHLHGGETTEGAFDESMRHAITKMAHLHFTAAWPYRERVIQMGEDPGRVFCFGAPGLDHLRRRPLLSRETVESKLGFKLGALNFLVTFHPVTLDGVSGASQAEELLKALDHFPQARVLITYPSADPGYAAILKKIKRFGRRHPSRVLLRPSLGQEIYLSLLQVVDAMIGNSSSGIIEMPSFKKPTVNIGDRQKGRLMAASVISCAPRKADIVRAIRRALAPSFKKTLAATVNPYWNGDASIRIKNTLRDFNFGPEGLQKKFHNFDARRSGQRRCVVVAEAGVNHNGSLENAKKLVRAAAAAGADWVKFQTFATERLVIRDAPKAHYQEKAAKGACETQSQMLKKLELDEKAHRKLVRYCRRLRIGFMSSPFDVESVRFLAKLRVQTIKIPSGEITHAPYLLEVARTGLPVILSTGMATLSEVEAALCVLAFGLTGSRHQKPSVQAFRDAFASAEGQDALQKKVALLHCVSEYPAPAEEMNLLAMDVLKERFGLPVGLSDHSAGIAVPTAAVALGAVCIEKHLTLDRRQSGPDHSASLEPGEFKAMVDAIRKVEKALGRRVKAPAPCELKNIAVVRKSLRAAAPIRRGETFNEKNLTALRPASGISPMLYWETLGKKAERHYAAGEKIS